MHSLLTVGKGIAAAIFLGLVTLASGPFIVLLVLLRFLFPFAALQPFYTAFAKTIATLWLIPLDLGLNRLGPTRVQHLGSEGRHLFSTQHWYLILSNHQSWVDIFVLFHIFRGKIPFLKFFLKSKLKWIPIVGWAWWALDYPFMKRYQPHQIAKNPKLKEKDHQTALAACRKFARTPTSVINFVEGTRFTPKKKEQQKSPFNHLLRPKAGGISQVLRVLGHQLNHILDVTIVYPDGSPSFWQYLTGKVTRVSVLIHALPVSKDLIGDYQSDPHFRQAFQEWLNELWHKKDQTIEVLLQSSSDRLDPQNPGVAHASS